MNILITGAAGFLGGRLTKYLAAHEGFSVRATSRRTHRTEELQQAGAEFWPFGATPLTLLMRGVDAVVHCAALSSPWGRYDAFYQANVALTERLLVAAQEAGVQRFVNISTPSLYNDYRDVVGARESDPLPEPINHYAATKRMAELRVQAAHGAAMKTLSIRPRALIGAEDVVIFPRVMRAYDLGRLRIIGSGDNMVDFTAVHNLCRAIELALRAPAEAYGRTYNVTDGQPVPMWSAINTMLTRLGKAPVRRHLPYSVADAVARLSEWRARRSRAYTEPALTRYGVAVLSRSFTLDITAAREHLGYRPQQTTDEAITEFVNWYLATARDEYLA